jgi:hypothetical protein
LHVGTKRWADIYVDGVHLGRAPSETRFALSPGIHILVAKNPHCASFKQKVTIRGDEVTRARLSFSCSSEEPNADRPHESSPRGDSVTRRSP